MQSLRELAPENMLDMLVTLEVSKKLSGWLKELASWNMPVMLVTLEVSKELSGWLKELAPRNMLFMLVTLEVLHMLTSSSNVEQAALQAKLACHEPDCAQKT